MWVYIWSRLPSEYQEVEYIQSSGTQYLQIWSSFKTSYKTVIDFQMTVTWGDQVPVWLSNAGRYWLDAWQWYFKVITWWWNWSNTIAEDKNRHTITINKSTVTVDGTNYSCSYSDVTFSYWIGVFTYIHSNWREANSSNKLYKLDIYDENWVHIYDLVPCYRKSDSVIGLYDLVNNQFYTNSWSGTFSKWSDVNTYRESSLKNAYIGEYKPFDAYQEVEYIRTSWTQYINTNITTTWTDNTTIEWDIKFYNTVSSSQANGKNTKNWLFMWVSWNNKFYWGSWSSWWETTVTNDKEKHNLRISTSEQKLYIDNVWYSVTWGTSEYTASWYICIWCVHTPGYSQYWYFCQEDIYSFKVTQWWTLVRDFIPCYRKSDNVIWLYDLVNDVFYTNAWTGTFTKWPDVN